MKYKILITGGAGYIGSVLSTMLVDLGHKVTVLDKLNFSKNSLLHLQCKKNFSLIKGDVRNVKILRKIIKNQDFIIPLAALVGAPLCQKKPKEAVQVNLNAIKVLIKHLKKNQKIIYMNSNSGYGIGSKGKFCDENSPMNPISLYGKTKANAENEVLKFRNSVCYRLATVFGYSFRMRTDLLVNFLTLKAVKDKQLDIFEPHFRRNYIHVRDVCRGIIFAIKNFKKMKGNIFNLGLSNANLDKISLAKKIAKIVGSVKNNINTKKSDPDKRDYYVSNKKIEKQGFKTIFNLEDGVQELKKVYEVTNKFGLNNY